MTRFMGRVMHTPEDTVLVKNLLSRSFFFLSGSPSSAGARTCWQTSDAAGDGLGEARELEWRSS